MKKELLDIISMVEEQVIKDASEMAYKSTESISDKDIQSITYKMIKDSIIAGAHRYTFHIINSINEVQDKDLLLEK